MESDFEPEALDAVGLRGSFIFGLSCGRIRSARQVRRVLWLDRPGKSILSILIAAFGSPPFQLASPEFVLVHAAPALIECSQPVLGGGVALIRCGPPFPCCR